MDKKSFSRQEKMLKLREELLAVEDERLRGAKYHSVDEIDNALESVIENVENDGANLLLALEEGEVDAKENGWFSIEDLLKELDKDK